MTATVSLKRVARFAYGDSLATEDREDGNVLVFGSNGQVGLHAHANTGHPVIVVGRKGSFGEVQYSDEPVFAIDTTYYIDRTQTTNDIRWLYYVLLATDLGAFSADTGVPGLSRETAYQRRVLWVPMELQRLIADFLDRETHRIDALVDAKRRMIELLYEKTASEIGLAVTTSGNSSNLIKTSVPWAAEIPETWQLAPLSRLVGLQRGHDLPEQNREYGDVPLLSSGGITGHVTTAKAEGPGIVTGRYGSVGQVYWIEEDYWPLNTTLYSAEFRLGQPRYVFYLLRHLPFDREAGKSAVPGVSRMDIHPMLVPLPPVAEQDRIARRLDVLLDTIRTTQDTLESQLTLLTEYRQALITKAVTGQLDEATLKGDKPVDEAVGVIPE